MTAQPKPAESEALSSPRAPLATGTREQKARFDALSMVLRGGQRLTADEALDLAEYVIAGPEDEEEAP